MERRKKNVTKLKAHKQTCDHKEYQAANSTKETRLHIQNTRLGKKIKI